ncbi:MAG: acyloxyacyl hydrolase [Candidatus Euphemobacter frigidus]|nr:acyloxyacyl hydrolase [Candidatus Euphemobacter frigidus]MDP8274858.1 acyloxyacyl hydrolase [Candidatus Euphemobacter frigidus]
MLGSYVSTLRNLNTEGVVLAYRLWFKPGQDDGFSILHPRPLELGFELRGGCLWKPKDTGEGSLLIDLKYELDPGNDFGFYLLAGLGGNYSGVSYTEVATHFNFIERGSLGIRIFRFIIQTSYEHRSNAGLRSPNRGIDLLTVSLGLRY